MNMDINQQMNIKFGVDTFSGWLIAHQRGSWLSLPILSQALSLFLVLLHYAFWEGGGGRLF